MVFFGTLLIIVGTVNDTVPLNIIGWICLIAAAIMFFNYRSREERLKREEEATALLERRQRAIRESEESLIEVQPQLRQQGNKIFPTGQVQLPGPIDDPSLLAPLEAGPLEPEEMAEEPPGEPVQLLPTSASQPEPRGPIQPPDALQPPAPAAPLASVLAPVKPISYQASPKPAVLAGAPASRFSQPAGSTPASKPEPSTTAAKPAPPEPATPGPAAKPEPAPKPELPASPEPSAGSAPATGGGFSYQPKMINSRFGKPEDESSGPDEPDAPAGR